MIWTGTVSMQRFAARVILPVVETVVLTWARMLRLLVGAMLLRRPEALTIKGRGGPRLTDQHSSRRVNKNDIELGRVGSLILYSHRP